MEVILLERIEKLGQMGDVVKVKPGFARNYLLPRRKALRATEANKAQFEVQKAQLEAVNLERKVEAEAVAKKMDGLSVVMVRQAGESGQLYGSVSTRDLAQSVIDAGFTVDRSQIRLERPIKSIGLFEVMVALHPEVVIPVTVNVARSQEEAGIQAETGRALIAAEEERREQEAEQASRIAADAAAAAAAAAAAQEAADEAGDDLAAEADETDAEADSSETEA